LGWYCDLSLSGLSEVIMDLLLDKKRRIDMSWLGQVSIDGSGAKRIVNLLTKSMVNYEC